MRARHRPRLSQRSCRLLRDLAWLAIIICLLVTLRQITWAIERPDLERDLFQVYEELPRRFDFDNFHLWCGLRMTLATTEEAEQARAVLRSSTNPEAFLCELPEWPSRDHIKGIARSNATMIQWSRIHHPAGPDQWIAIGVMNMYRLAPGPEHRIIYRVPIGFAADGN